MGAACYLCELNYGTIPDHGRGDAVGACKLCGVLACLAHGVRNKSRPAYICGCCAPNLLTAAAHKAGGAAAPPARPPDAGDPAGDLPSGFAIWARDIEDVSDVITDLADDHWAWLRDDMDYLSRLLAGTELPADLRAYARPEAARARVLMAAAAALAVRLELPERELLPELQRVALEVRRV